MKKNTIMTVAVLLILTVSLYFVATTYANYGEEASSNTTASIAKWNVKFNNKSSDSVSETFKLTVQYNADVVDNKLAPGTKATGQVALNLEGTEVAVDLTADVDTESLSSTLGVAPENIKAKVTLDGTEINGTPHKIDLPEGNAFDSTPKNIQIEVEWTADGENDANDTKIGQEKGDTDLTIPVTLKVSQHTGE